MNSGLRNTQSPSAESQHRCCTASRGGRGGWVLVLGGREGEECTSQAMHRRSCCRRHHRRWTGGGWTCCPEPPASHPAHATNTLQPGRTNKGASRGGERSRTAALPSPFCSRVASYTERISECVQPPMMKMKILGVFSAGPPPAAPPPAFLLAQRGAARPPAPLAPDRAAQHHIVSDFYQSFAREDAVSPWRHVHVEGEITRQMSG